MPEQSSEGTYLRAVKEPLGGPERAPWEGLESPPGRPQKGVWRGLYVGLGRVQKGGLEGPLFFTPGALGGPGIPYFGGSPNPPKSALRGCVAGCPSPKIWSRNPGKTQIFGGTQGAPRVPFPQLYMMKESAMPGHPAAFAKWLQTLPNIFQGKIKENFEDL